MVATEQVAPAAAKHVFGHAPGQKIGDVLGAAGAARELPVDHDGAAIRSEENIVQTKVVVHKRLWALRASCQHRVPFGSGGSDGVEELFADPSGVAVAQI